MEPPAKRRRITKDLSPPNNNTEALHPSWADLQLKFKSKLEEIFEKYGKDFTGIGDEIDLRTGEIVVNNGHLIKLRDKVDGEDAETDSGWDVGAEINNGWETSSDDEDILALSNGLLRMRRLGSGLAVPLVRNDRDLDAEKLITMNWKGQEPRRPKSKVLEPPNAKCAHLRAERIIRSMESLTTDPKWQAPQLPDNLLLCKGVDTSSMGGKPESVPNEPIPPETFIWHGERDVPTPTPRSITSRWSRKELDKLKHFRFDTELAYSDLHHHFPGRKLEDLRIRWCRMKSADKQSTSTPLDVGNNEDLRYMGHEKPKQVPAHISDKGHRKPSAIKYPYIDEISALRPPRVQENLRMAQSKSVLNTSQSCSESIQAEDELASGTQRVPRPITYTLPHAKITRKSSGHRAVQSETNSPKNKPVKSLRCRPPASTFPKPPSPLSELREERILPTIKLLPTKHYVPEEDSISLEPTGTVAGLRSGKRGERDALEQHKSSSAEETPAMRPESLSGVCETADTVPIAKSDAVKPPRLEIGAPRVMQNTDHDDQGTVVKSGKFQRGFTHLNSDFWQKPTSKHEQRSRLASRIPVLTAEEGCQSLKTSVTTQDKPQLKAGRPVNLRSAQPTPVYVPCDVKGSETVSTVRLHTSRESLSSMSSDLVHAPTLATDSHESLSTKDNISDVEESFREPSIEIVEVRVAAATVEETVDQPALPPKVENSATRDRHNCVAEQTASTPEYSHRKRPSFSKSGFKSAPTSQLGKKQSMRRLTAPREEVPSTSQPSSISLLSLLGEASEDELSIFNPTALLKTPARNVVHAGLTSPRCGKNGITCKRSFCLRCISSDSDVGF
ncbi:MAG: hypothetical protein LQ340_004054 [Diploschistes diacapsis]|nr:MAG: hypothetical protein LQ340_004054 [Diploschistes diacapsis]